MFHRDVSHCKVQDARLGVAPVVQMVRLGGDVHRKGEEGGQRGIMRIISEHRRLVLIQQDLFQSIRQLNR